ncbi:MAG: hypothetical protein ACLQVA_12965 [Candidatus Brocadiia bacterium]
MSHRLYGGAVCGLLLAWILPGGFSIAQGQPKGEAPGAAAQASARMDPTVAKEWMQRWKQSIISDGRDRPCDKEMGEEIGWLVSPFLNGYYYGCLATGDREWVDRLIDWTDSVIKRGVKEPDGYIGWPKEEEEGVLDYLPAGVAERYTDVEVGDALFLRPVALMAGEILKTPALKEKYGAKAEEYLQLAERTFEKWNSRGAWRDTKEGGIWVVPQFALDPKTGQWTDGYELRKTEGNSLPDNKENIIAEWMLAMYDATHKPIYKERAEKWFQVMKSRMKLRDDGKYFVWDYWDPGVPWDTNADGSLKHWVGVHPNGGYYLTDVTAIVAAYEHGLVFTREDIARLIATNRDFMWNQQIKGAKFQRIDGEKADPRWANSPGLLWTPLAPYDPTLRKIFEANHNPGGWGGLTATPQWVARFGRTSEAAQ